MFRNVIAPILLLLSGLINLFPRTLSRYVEVGYEAVTIQTVIGFVSVVLAIGILSGIKFGANGSSGKEQ